MVATSTITRGAEKSRRITDQLHDRAEQRADDQDAIAASQNGMS